MKKIQILGIVMIVLIIIGMNFIPLNTELTDIGKDTLAVLLVTLVLLITEPIPIGVTCILAIALMVVFNTSTLPEALSGYTNPIIFFVIVSFGISKAITKLPLSRRLLVGLIELFGRNVKTLILSIMICTALVSSIISNVAATAIFIPIIMEFLSIYKDEKERKKSGMAFMIALPVASMIGGMMTPAGSSLNLLAISLLEQQSGLTITFIHWMVYGIPIVIIALPISWLIIIKMYKPVEINYDEIITYVDSIKIRNKLSFKEKYVLILFSIMFILWVLGSWYPIFNITVVTIIGFTFLFLPGIQIIQWHEFTSSVSWEAIFLVGTIISLGGVVIKNGVSSWLVDVVFPSAFNLPIQGVLLVLSLMVFLLLVIMPVAPALISMLAPPFIIMAGDMGISPILFILTLSLCAANCYLLPLDTVPLLTYTTGYYKMIDMPKSTIFIQLVIAGIISLWLPIAFSILG